MVRGGRSFLGHSRQWMVPVLLFVLALPAITPRLYAGDEVGYFANLRSLWFDHDVSFDNEYRYFYDRGIAVAWTFYESYLVRETATGLRYSYWTVGPAILWSPFYAVADVTTRIRRAFGSEVPADGFSRPYLRAVTFGLRVLRLPGHLHSHRHRAPPGGGGASGRARHLARHAAAPLYVHRPRLQPRVRCVRGGAVRRGLVARARDVVTRRPDGAGRRLRADGDGARAGGPSLSSVRPSTTSGRSPARPGRPTGRASGRWSLRVAAGAAVSLLCYSPQMLIYLSLYGQLTTPYTLDDRMLWHAPHFFDVLFHPNHGFFFWTPLALVAVGGLAWFAWSGGGRGDAGARRIGICLLAMFASQAYIAGAILRWELSGTYGQRRFIGTTIILVIGLTALFKLAQRPVWRRAAVTLAVAGVIWNVGLMAQYGAQLMNRGRVELARKRLHDGVRPAARPADARLPLPLRPPLVLPRPGTLQRAVRDAQ